MAEPTLYPKFLRSHTSSNTANASESMAYFMRVFYEFWGFCVNGTNNLKAPGGYSTSHTTGTYIVMPTGWESGSTVLRASGSDGSTFQGTTVFTSPSAKFSASFKGKHITIWESGSLSTDDSIYPIVEWVNSSSIMIDPTYGGTVMNPTTGSVPVMTTRTNLNWRVIDYQAASVITPRPEPGFLVVEFNDAGKVNPGQLRSQVKLSVRTETSVWDEFRFQFSPSGSWDGTQFVGAFEGLPYCPEIGLDGGYGSGGWAFDEFFHGIGGIGFTTIVADKTFIIAQAGNWSAYGWPSAFMIEIPRRLYPAHMDPNPMCGFAAGAIEVQTIAFQGWGWAGRHMPSPYDSTPRRYQAAMPCYNGWFWERSMHSNQAPQTLNPQRYPVYYNQVVNTTYLPPLTMYLGWFQTQESPLQPSVQGKTSMGRVRLRSQRQVPNGIHRLALIQDGANKWIHVGAGVLWPWDNAYVPTRHLFKDMADGFNFS